MTPEVFHGSFAVTLLFGLPGFYFFVRDEFREWRKK